MKYPFLNSLDSNHPYAAEIEDAVLRVVRSGRYIGGEEVERFELTLASHAHTPYAVGVSNGLDALRLIFRSLVIMGRVAEGDEVIVPANTYIASILAIIDAGLKPVFAEPSLDTLNLDTTRLGEYITPRTRAILTVHLYGRPCFDESMKQFAEQNDLIIIEDNAQAIGAQAPVAGMSADTTTGGLGLAAAFSFYPTKNIGAMGDAGAVATHDRELADTVRALANYGSDRRYHNIYTGFNCRLDPIQAAILAVKLPHVDEESNYRDTLARTYINNIHNDAIILPSPPDRGTHVWHQFVVRVNAATTDLSVNKKSSRHHLRQYLDDNGVGTDVHYATPPHRQPALEPYSTLNLPITDTIADTVISLPITRTTIPDDALAIASIINGYRK